MGFSKEEKAFRRIAQLVIFPRWMKTLFFIVTMIISLLLFSAPLLLIIADALLPSAFLSATLSPEKISNLWDDYDFRYSLVDIPIVSIFRSVIILCVYSFCDRPRRPYLVVASVLTAASLLFVSLKASYMFVIRGSGGGENWRSGYNGAMELAMFVSSVGLGIGHVVVAYRTSCRERRKLMVYKIDIEAVSACYNGFLDAKKYPRRMELIRE